MNRLLNINPYNVHLPLSCSLDIKCESELTRHIVFNTRLQYHYEYLGVIDILIADKLYFANHC